MKKLAILIFLSVLPVIAQQAPFRLGPVVKDRRPGDAVSRVLVGDLPAHAIRDN